MRDISSIVPGASSETRVVGSCIACTGLFADVHRVSGDTVNTEFLVCMLNVDASPNGTAPQQVTVDSVLHVAL